MARAESTRLLMWKWGVPYEDKRLAGPEWGELKAKVQPEKGIGGMPILELPDGTMLGQSTTIINYIATMAGLHPTDPKDIAKGELLYETFIKDGGKIWASNLPKEGPERDEAMKEKKDVLWPKMCKSFERYITEDKKFIAGDVMTTHDYTVGILLINVFKNPTKPD